MTLTSTVPPPEHPAEPSPDQTSSPRVGRSAGGLSRVGESRPAVAVAALALAAAVWAVAASALFLPRLSDNGDEAVYLLQAESLRAGHLFPPAPQPAGAFLPWLSKTTGDHFVTKYTPVFPGFIALSHLMFGTARAALALTAAGAVLACYCLGREVLGRRREALIGAAFFAGSPLFAIQSATYLSYLFNAALLMGFAAAFLTGVRRRRPSALALAGLLAGLAIFARPFDAVLFAAPLLLWWAWSGRRDVRRRIGEAAWVAFGAFPPLAAMVVYFHLATGSVLRPPFTFVGPEDTLGFGPKRMYPGMPHLDFTPGRALVAFGRLVVLTGFWGFGGLLLIGLAVAGYRAARDRPRWLVLVTATVPVGYAFFWGSFSSTEWGGPWRFGPFYWLPVVIPTSILAAAGFARLRRFDRLVARFVAGGMALVSAFVVVRALAEHGRYRAVRDRLYAAPLQAAAELDSAVVFVPPLDGPYLLQPFSLARNATFDGAVVWAIDRGPRKNLDVVQRFPGRTPYRVVLGATDRLPSRLQRLTVVHGRLVPDRFSVDSE